MNSVIPRAIGPLGPGFQKPLSRRRLARIERGAVSQRLPAARVGDPRVGAMRLIRVPRNFTFPLLVLVIRVFSSDRARPKDCRKEPML